MPHFARLRHCVELPDFLARADVVAPAPFERIPLKQQEWPPGYNTVSMVVKIAPNGVIPPHVHPGVESGYLQDGEITLSVKGQADVTSKAGGSWMIPGDAVHSAKAGPNGATAVVSRSHTSWPMTMRPLSLNFS